MLERPQSGDNIFCKVKNDNSIILIDSFGKVKQLALNWTLIEYQEVGR